MENVTSKLDNRNLGLIAGFLSPFIVVFVQLTVKDYDWGFFLETFKANKTFASGILTICLIINGIVFGILVQFKKQLTAIGLFIPTAILGAGLLIYKLFL